MVPLHRDRDPGSARQTVGGSAVPVPTLAIVHHGQASSALALAHVIVVGLKTVSKSCQPLVSFKFTFKVQYVQSPLLQDSHFLCITVLYSSIVTGGIPHVLNNPQSYLNSYKG